MPTNKLWIEHTEQAAWESVGALRSELADTKKRLERMTPPVEGWRELFDALDGLRDQHALGGKSYADVVRGLVDRLELAEHRLRAAQEELARAHANPAPAAVSTRSSAPVASEPAPPNASETFEAVARRFVRAMQHRYRLLARKGAPVGADEALGALLARVEELSEMDDIELADATVDVAVLALCLHHEARDDR